MPLPSDRRDPWSIAAAIDELAETAGASGDTGDRRSVGRFFRRPIDVASRRAVLHNVFFDSEPRWRSAFAVMLLLSGGIAALGLSQNSAATVIGSMIIAPLGAPIMALGGAVAVAWPRESVRMLSVVVLGSAGVVAVAFLLGLALPTATPDAQILARTSPDLRDLGVAVLAGAAGGYSLTRSNLSSSLVGVAIAVALVPPLATLGLMLEERRWTLARGAATLFVANLVGITIAVAVVLLVTGFAPVPRLRQKSAGVIVGLSVVVLVVAALAVPLARVYRRQLDEARVHTDVVRQIAATIGATRTDVQVTRVRINGDHVEIDVQGAANAPAAATFEADLIDELGAGVTVTVVSG